MSPVLGSVYARLSISTEFFWGWSGWCIAGQDFSRQRVAALECIRWSRESSKIWCGCKALSCPYVPDCLKVTGSSIAISFKFTVHTRSLLLLLRRLWPRISLVRRRQLMLLFVLMVLASFAEVLSIGAVMPFLGVLTAPESVFKATFFQPIIRIFGLGHPEELLFPVTVLFCVSSVFAGGMRLLLLWASTRLAFATGADLSNEIYRRTLYQRYSVHVSRNSSEVISGISAKANDVIYSAIFPVLMISSAVIMLVAILIALLSISPEIAMLSFAGFGGIYLIVIRLTRFRLSVNSEHIARESVNVIKALQEGLGGIRDVLLDGTQPTYCDIYRSADLPLRRAQGSNQFLGSFPRYGIETLGMVLIAVLAYKMACQPTGITTAIPILGGMALGAQRLLPVLQQAYGNWTAMLAGQRSIEDALDLLDQPLPAYAVAPDCGSVAFAHSIEFRNVGFRYSADTPWVLRGLQLTIRKGCRVGIIGTTGSGKSTTLDLLMGLLQPSCGAILIDGMELTIANVRGWQSHIAHVPQSIYLADTSIAENIAFGTPLEQIDLSRVRRAARQAQIEQTIEAWPAGYATRVGERGVRLSGGQRQRIGIARALYKQADVIVLDEATSALDNETESAVMQALEALSQDLTVVIIAHRLSTLRGCGQVVQLAEGAVVRMGTYSEIVGK